MTDSIPSPANIDKLEYAVWPSYSLLAGIQLDLFTVLKDGPISVEQMARGMGVRADKLQPLLYTLVAVGLLTVDGNLFSNSIESSQFLVRGLVFSLQAFLLQLRSFHYTFQQILLCLFLNDNPN